ncbi:NAD(P)-binding protein [Exidia glandulosa HHB12029]|uniref:NAD(P)-binding protein n=1 Tax=Exidia glandulosa HHB12029 TaxID=1314781 RepID=A0A166N959_EXIGL|nr:NAD(P)-binding protein [Exidia glandulosa HHB12029]
MSDKKIITVFGATGAAGGSVARYLLADGTFAVRAVTRNASSAAAKALKARGAEVVEADLNKPQTIAATLIGAYGVSANTDFWTLFPLYGQDAVKTQAALYAQGVALVDAAKAAGVKHFVWFTLPHATPTVPHFECNYQVELYLKASGVPYTTFLNAFYYENLATKGYGFIKRLGDASLSLEIPMPADAHIPVYSVGQTGGWILSILKNPSEYIGKHVDSVAEHLTPKRLAEVLSSALHTEVKAKDVSNEEFAAMGAATGDPVAQEVFLIYPWFIANAQPPNSVFNQAASRKVFPEALTFEEFVKGNEDFRNTLAKV